MNAPAPVAAAAAAAAQKFDSHKGAMAGLDTGSGRGHSLRWACKKVQRCTRFQELSTRGSGPALQLHCHCIPRGEVCCGLCVKRL